MSVLDRLASALGRNDEVPNEELAKELVKNKDSESIKLLVEALFSGSTAIMNDCIKVLYEIGEQAPDLISPYAEEFIKLLSGKNNRLIWGSMTALSAIALDCPDKLFVHIDIIIKSIENGSVITVDNGISVLAKVGSAKKEYEEVILPFIIKHLSSCRPKEVAQHSERSSIIANPNNKLELVGVMEGRLQYLTDSQKSRVRKVIKQINAV